eukprot:scaffold180397_cov25-Tisochrysis_lutea.AAC.3
MDMHAAAATVAQCCVSSSWTWYINIAHEHVCSSSSSSSSKCGSMLPPGQQMDAMQQQQQQRQLNQYAQKRSTKEEH